MKHEEIVALLRKVFLQLKQQNSPITQLFVIQSTVINTLFPLFPCTHSELKACVEELLHTKSEGDIEFKTFIFHCWCILLQSFPNESVSSLQQVITEFCHEVFAESVQPERKKSTKVPHQRKTQAENQSQQQEKISSLQHEVISMLSAFLVSHTKGTETVLEDIVKCISSPTTPAIPTTTPTTPTTIGAIFPPLIACHVSVCILQQKDAAVNPKVEIFRAKVMPFLCGFLHTTRSGLRTYVIDQVLPACFNNTTSYNHLQVLWGSIALLPDDLEVLLYFFKFGSLLLSAAKQEGENFKVFEDRKFWDSLKKGLIATDSMPRKQALFLLKNIVNLPYATWNKYIPWNCNQWQTFFSLYEAMDESKSHLLKPIWGQIETLLPPETSALAPFELEPTQAPYWSAVLLARGLTHSNPNVRDLVLSSLLNIPPQVLQLESSFLFSTLFAMFNDLGLADLDATVSRYASLMGKFLSDYLHSFADYEVTAQGFTSSMIEYMRDSATITTPAIIFLLECIIQLGILHASFWRMSKGKCTLLLSATSLEYLRSILECKPIAESTIQNSKLYEKALTTAIELTNMGPGTHPPSAFDFQTLTRFLSTFPYAFLRNAKLSARVAAWIARFEHLDAQHLRNVMRELLEGTEGEQGDEKRFSQKLLLFTRVFALCAKIEMFEEIISEMKSQLGSNGKHTRSPFGALLMFLKGSKLHVCIEIARSVLQALYEIRVSEEDKRAFAVVLEPVVPPLITHFKNHVRVFLEGNLQDGTGDLNTYEQALKLRGYAAFMTACLKMFPQVALEQNNNLMDIFMQFALFFNSSTEFGYPINTINSALYFWNSTAQDINTQTWQSWHEKDILLELMPKLLKVNARGSGTKTNELVSEFISNKWAALTILMEKSQQLRLSVPPNLMEELFSCGLEVLDQADYESLPFVYNFLHTLLYNSANAGSVPVAIANNVEHNAGQLLEAAWKSFAECKRKTIPLIASFIGLIFHSILFHIATEQVRPYLRRAIVEFAESPRIASSVAAHFCGVCASDLSLAFSFLPELVDMCLTTEPAHLFGLPDIPEYATWSSGHGLVITALVAGLPKTPTVSEFLGKLVLELIEQNFTNAEFVTREHSQHSHTNKRKVRMWITLSALVEYLGSDCPQLEVINQKAWLALQIKNHKNIRKLAQSFMLKFLHKHPRYLTLGLFPLLDDTNLQYQVAASVVIIASRVLLDTKTPPLSDFWVPLFCKLVPWSFHFHHAVRTCAQVALYTIMETSSDVVPFNDPSLVSMVHFLRTNKDCVRLRVRQRWFATKKDAGRKDAEGKDAERKDAERKDRGVGDAVTRHEEEAGGDVEDEEEEGETGTIPMDLLEHVKKAVKEFQAAMATAEVPDSTTEGNKSEGEKESTSDFQKRILPWQMLDTLPQLETREIKKQRQSIIIVASLIDNTPNIAGLIRTSEIFNVEAVVIGNKKIESEAQFQRVSVSAEKWVPILEVTPSNLPLFLKEKSKLGYSMLGVEQTAYSESLATFEFPDKCVLVLGQEQLGIPADIIQLLDKCVEIPQLGMIRSLNVHVSASIAIWAYTQQHLEK